MSDSDDSTAALDAQIAALEAKKAAKLAKAARARAAQEAEERRTLVQATPTKGGGAGAGARAPSESFRLGGRRSALPTGGKGADVGLGLTRTGPNTYAQHLSPPRQPHLGVPAVAGSSKRPSVPRDHKPTVVALPSLPDLRERKSGLAASLAALRRSDLTGGGREREGELLRPSESRPSHPQGSMLAKPAKCEMDLTGRGGPEAQYGYSGDPNGEGDEDGDGDGEGHGARVQRDDDTLAILEKLTLGPKQFGRDPEGGDEWLSVEPNSGIRLMYVVTLLSLPCSLLSPLLSPASHIPVHPSAAPANTA